MNMKQREYNKNFIDTLFKEEIKTSTTKTLKELNDIKDKETLIKEISSLNPTTLKIILLNIMVEKNKIKYGQ